MQDFVITEYCQSKENAQSPCSTWDQVYAFDPARWLWLTEFPGCCGTGMLHLSRLWSACCRGTESLCRVFHPNLLSFSVWLSLPHVSLPSSWLQPRSAASSCWNACWRERAWFPSSFRALCVAAKHQTVRMWHSFIPLKILDYGELLTGM